MAAIRLIELTWKRFQLRNVDPMYPDLINLIVRIADLEKTT